MITSEGEEEGILYTCGGFGSLGFVLASTGLLCGPSPFLVNAATRIW